MAGRRVEKRRRRIEYKSESSSSSWSDLPYDLLELIMKRLFYVDQIKVNAVCKNWNTSVSIHGIKPIQKQMPYLLVFEDDQRPWSSLKLIDPTYKKTYNVDINIFKEKNINLRNGFQVQESKNGWLLISISSSSEVVVKTFLFMYSPFLSKNNLIELPVLNYSLLIATFNFNPSCSGDKECLIIALSSSSGYTLRISQCRFGDNTWKNKYSLCNFPLSLVRHWMYSDGIFYLVTPPHTIRSVNVAGDEWYVFPQLPIRNWISPLDSIYLVKFDGEVLLIVICVCPISISATSEQVNLRLDPETMTWKEVSSLDDQVLFLGNGYKSLLTVPAHKEIANRTYYCSGSIMKHWKKSKANQGQNYPCSKHYGLLAKLQWKKVWIDPPH